MTKTRAKMAFADAKGRIFEHPELELVGWDGDCWRPLEDDEITPLPPGSDLFTLPGRLAAGLDRDADEVVVYDVPGTSAVSCFIAPAYLRTLLPAYQTLEDAPALPLFAYSVVGLRDGELVTATVRVDDDVRQDPLTFDLDEIALRVDARRVEHPDNRLVEHLSHCALVYHCRAAQNYFLDRFEAPLPAAATCNALCVGCISLQPKGGDEQVVAAHDRIRFAPTVDELAEVALGHIARVGADAVVSFGQGCEGEPLNQPLELEGLVRRVRAATPDGVLNLNSNASRPHVIRRLVDAGLDSLRISTNSARADVYAAYYRPKGYTFADVRESARVIRDAGRYLMLNYFVFPGVTDTEAELDALSAWIDEAGIAMIQLRNLNLDPEVYLETVAAAGDPGGAEGTTEPMGLLVWLARLRDRFPDLAFGYFNPPRRRFAQAPTVAEPVAFR